jgi:general secretion pathway protein D
MHDAGAAFVTKSRMRIATVVACCLLVALQPVLRGQDSPFVDANSLVWRAEALEADGKITEAWTLYSQAATLDPKNARAAGKALQLRVKALEGAHLALDSALGKAKAGAGKDPVDPADPLLHIAEGELRDLERMLPPPALVPKPGTIDLSQKADGKVLYTKFLEHFGIDVIFDGDYDNPTGREVKISGASFEEGLYALGIATNSFVIPIAPKLAMVIRDTDQKRRDQERTVAITFQVPTAISSPEAQELARAVQQIFELQRVAVDTTRGQMLIRDRWSKVRPAQMALEQLLSYRSQVMIEVEFYQVNETSNLSYGFSLPNSSQLVPFVTRKNLTTSLAGYSKFLSFGGGATLFGLGVTAANLFASMTHTNTSSLLQAQMRSLDGLAATLHVGDKYPVITALFTFPGENSTQPPPQVQFEDLGLTLKITPHVHANDEVTLDLETEFKVLTGQTNNNIPVISSRKYTGTVRLREGEWAVATGLVTRNEARSIKGIAGLASIPIVGPALSTNGRDKSDGQTLLVLRPRRIGVHPGDRELREIWTGSETKFLAPVR